MDKDTDTVMDTDMDIDKDMKKDMVMTVIKFRYYFDQQVSYYLLKLYFCQQLVCCQSIDTANWHAARALIRLIGMLLEH